MFFISILVYLKFSIEWCNFQALFPELIFLTMGSLTIFEEPYIGISPGNFGMLGTFCIVLIDSFHRTNFQPGVLVRLYDVCMPHFKGFLKAPGV